MSYPQAILLSAEGVGTNAIMRETGKSKTCVWRWQERFAGEGVDGLLRDKTRPSRIPKLDPSVAERVVALTMEEPPHEATHWTSGPNRPASALRRCSASGRLTGCSRIASASSICPRTPRSSTSCATSSGSMSIRRPTPSCFSVDEKSQIQALDRTQPGLPLKKGRAGTMTHDYKRNGTTTLFAAMNVLDGTVIGRNMQRHRHPEFIRFLNAVEREVPAGKTVHAILDNYAAHKNPIVRRWLARHPRWTFHFTPTSASWLNAVEGFFAILTKRRLKRGVFRSVADLQAAINRFLEDHNDHAKPFLWVANPDKIIAAVRRGHQVLDSIH